MPEKLRAKLLAGVLVVLGAVIFGAGINWGLPSREIDPFLFGTGTGSAKNARNSWNLTGVGIVRLTGGMNQSGNLPADIAAHPIGDRSQPIVLLENKPGVENPSDDVARARILSRYRLYSFQPDEMISFRALGSMHPGKLQFDPKLYQYGGLWIYPLGAIVKAASLLGYVTIISDPTFYLDSPAMFGRFYVLGRAYSAAWGIVAALAVFAIVRKATGKTMLAWIAALGFMCMPVVLDLAHEAKPHLAGTALMLLAILSAWKYVETGRWKWIIWTAIACGASAAMVLSGIVALAILPVMLLVRRDQVGRILGASLAGLGIAAAVYFAANPYVAIHLLGDPAVLHANLANTRAMYWVGGTASRWDNALQLLLAGTSLPMAVFALLWVVLGIFLKREASIRGLCWLVGVPAGIVLVQFILFAAGKPGEYGRFALLVDTAILLAGFISIARVLRHGVFQAAAALVILVFTIMHSGAYERGFLADAGTRNSRMEAAEVIDQQLSGVSPVLYITAEPAPYCLPPVNLFRWRIILLPRGGEVPPGYPRGLLVRPHQAIGLMDPNSTPISWANTEFDMAEVGGK
jgi:hypothetical protein